MKIKLALLSITLSSLTFSSVENIKKFTIEVPSKFMTSYNGPEKDFKEGFKTGFGSALAYKSSNSDGSIEFYALSDRGPNGDIPKILENKFSSPGKLFPTPNFVPSIGILKVSNKNAKIINSIQIKNQEGNNISGLPIPPGKIGSTGEIALDLTLKKLNYDIDGMDPEGIAVDSHGNFWIADEYGPFIVKTDKNGKILKKLEPGKGLPEILKYRIPNRGFEGLSIDKKGNIYATLQSTLDIEGKTKNTASFVRIIKINPNTEKVETFGYPLDKNYKFNSNAKIGDIYAIDENKLLIIEQGKQNEKMENLIYSLDLSDATDITNLNELEFSKENTKIQLGKKILVVNLRNYGWITEKAEGITLLPDNQTIALINDNDFGMSIDESSVNNERLLLKKNSENSELWLIKLKDKI
ncbi:MAG: esterase-like activity of phytase family protein [Cetobacterium sp.]|uniref:esterase-like activity of phytase family protein n=1 Tax=Cetobacterium sp. TaxID=2071632 RepID=UPI003F2A2BA4